MTHLVTSNSFLGPNRPKIDYSSEAIVKTFATLCETRDKNDLKPETFFNNLLKRNDVDNKNIYKAMVVLLDHPRYHKVVYQTISSLVKQNVIALQNLEESIILHLKEKTFNNNPNKSHTASFLQCLDDLMPGLQDNSQFNQPTIRNEQNFPKDDSFVKITISETTNNHNSELDEKSSQQLFGTSGRKGQNLSNSQLSSGQLINNNFETQEQTSPQNYQPGLKLKTQPVRQAPLSPQSLYEGPIVSSFRQEFKDGIQSSQTNPLEFFEKVFSDKKQKTNDICNALAILLDDEKFGATISEVIKSFCDRKILTLFFLESNICKHFKHKIENAGDDERITCTKPFVNLLEYFVKDRDIKHLPLLEGLKPKDVSLVLTRDTSIDNNNEKIELTLNPKIALGKVIYRLLKTFNNEEECDNLDLMLNFRENREVLLEQSYNFYNENKDKGKIQPIIHLFASMHAKSINDTNFLKEHYGPNTGFLYLVDDIEDPLVLTSPVQIGNLMLMQKNNNTDFPYFAYDISNKKEILEAVTNFAKSGDNFAIITLHDYGNYSHTLLKRDKEGSISVTSLLNPYKQSNYFFDSPTRRMLTEMDSTLKKHTSDFVWHTDYCKVHTDFVAPQMTDEKDLFAKFHNAGGIFGLLLGDFLNGYEYEFRYISASATVRSFNDYLVKSDKEYNMKTHLDCRLKLLQLGHKYKPY